MIPNFSQIVHIIEEVGTLLLKWHNLRIFEGKWEGSQFKAEVDLMAHQELESHLKKLAPNIPIISEENANSLIKDRDKVYWLIDPIDGTASFIKGYPGFVTQIALIEDNKPKLSVIYAPVLNELYTAKIGEGSYLNNKRLFVSNKGALKTLIDNYPEPRGITKKVYDEFKLKNYIECGSIALKICKVADGTADLFLKDVTVRDWDLAAPHLILEESGGILTDIYGNKFEYRGNNGHTGLIAAHSQKVNYEVVCWYSNFIKENK
jgi:3'(2'), 5'-bisphosphate nucleotidase/myo-inositol-1(or 4)-monophosphatase